MRSAGPVHAGGRRALRCDRDGECGEAVVGARRLSPRLGPLKAVTIVVSDLELAVRGYTSLLPNVEVLGEGTPANGGDDQRRVHVGVPGFDHGALELVEDRAARRAETFRTLGWAAVEILVADADEALARCLASPGFTVLQRPAPVGAAASSLRALQAAGPGGEGVYLTEVRSPPPGFALPDPAAEASLAYAVVAATDDLERTRAAFAGPWSLTAVTDHPLPVRVINQAFDLPPGTTHRVSTMQLRGGALLEVDQYPPAAAAAPAGDEPRAGIASVTFLGDSAADGVAPPGLHYRTTTA